MTPKSLLVTVGSTLFPSLTTKILSPEILTILSNSGVKHLIVQYGNTSPPSIPSLTGHVEVELIRFTDDFESLVKGVDGLISHAGSGSILTTLRASKPLLVVPNTSLMDNHQAELASALGEEGYLTVSTLEDLESNLHFWLAGASEAGQKAFPALDRGKFAGVLDEVAGFSGPRIGLSG